MTATPTVLQRALGRLTARVKELEGQLDAVGAGNASAWTEYTAAALALAAMVRETREEIPTERQPQRQHPNIREDQ